MNLFKLFTRQTRISSPLHARFGSTFESLVPPGDGSLALFSLSNDIFCNQALDSHLAENVKNHRLRSVLLLWISEPCIVLGRHQNPWLECHVKQAMNEQVKVVRRFSGGGCVYHDRGNLNISFICDRSKYDRQANLALIKNALSKLEFSGDIGFEITPRHDIFIRKANNLFKLSGSAARLAQNFAYHHCTLLFDANMSNMQLLRSNLASSIRTKATPSVRSKCLNLKEFSTDSSLNLMRIGEKLCEEYWRKQAGSWSIEHLFNYIRPEDDHELMLKLEPFHTELTSWQYVYGATPKFDLIVEIGDETASQMHEITLSITNGIIREHKTKTGSSSETLKTALDSL